MKNIKVVIGANFGDEGKGLMTDYFAAKENNPIVIRFNSSSQAGHTIVTPENKRHVFGHFGSGSLIGVPTFLSEYFSTNPLLFLKEYNELENINIRPIVYIDFNSPVVLPSDMIINQILEMSRGENRHGSCGLGYNESIIRNSINKYNIVVNDLIDNSFIDKIKLIRNEYISKRINELELEDKNNDLIEILFNDNLWENFIYDVKENFLPKIQILNFKDIFNKYDSLVFEGAQGLMLSEDYKYFPYVTHSKTGIDNVVSLLLNNDCSNDLNIEVVYISRCYFTRHGAGPLPNELDGKPYEGIIDRTNIHNEFQGSLRFAYLDLDILRDNINDNYSKIINDNSFKNCNISKSLTITCLNQIFENKLDMINYYLNNNLIERNMEKFLIDIKENIQSDKYYLGFNPTRNGIKID